MFRRAQIGKHPVLCLAILKADTSKKVHQKKERKKEYIKERKKERICKRKKERKKERICKRKKERKNM